MQLKELLGGGGQLLDKLAAQGITTPFDLLLHLPLRYLDKTRLTPVAALRHGRQALIEATVARAHVDFGRRRSLAVLLEDDSGDRIIVRLFYFNQGMQAQMRPGVRLRCYGEPGRGKTGLELFHPGFQVLPPGKRPPLAERLEPVYPKLEGLGPKRLSALVGKILNAYRDSPPRDPLHAQELESMPLLDALQQLHFPSPDANLALLADHQHPAQLRLVREELTAQQLFMRRSRALQQRHAAAPFAPISGERLAQFTHKLHFSLTGAQQRAFGEIAEDLQQTRPMLRLVQGDVGSGKTLVALLAALQVIDGGAQAAFMAPTELLSEQHFTQAQRLLAPLGKRCALLRGSETQAARRGALESLALGVVDLVVGTHALFQQGVRFHRLGLVIIDEQHRFGVHQRMALRDKGQDGDTHPHQLVMTATPIPRTLAMTAYADLELTLIDEMPPGRKPVQTRLIAASRRANLLARLQGYCAEGNQAYWVCRLVSESELLDCESAEKTYADLCEALPHIRFGLIHGRCHRDEKQRVMQAFRDGEIQVLVATTVIEVGVDVPNANLIVIENAEQLGLAQLHQLRGRVGRGDKPAWCLLMHADDPGQGGRERLRIMREHSSGFVIAEEDMKIRGPGQLLGSRQSGAARLRLADLRIHLAQLESARAFASRLTDPGARQLLIERWFRGSGQYLSS